MSKNTPTIAQPVGAQPRKSLVWQPDDSSSCCIICELPWTFTNRRHHCRTCGALVCQSCSNISREGRICILCSGPTRLGVANVSKPESSSETDLSSWIHYLRTRLLEKVASSFIFPPYFADISTSLELYSDILQQWGSQRTPTYNFGVNLLCAQIFQETLEENSQKSALFECSGSAMTSKQHQQLALAFHYIRLAIYSYQDQPAAEIDVQRTYCLTAELGARRSLTPASVSNPPPILRPTIIPVAQPTSNLAPTAVDMQSGDSKLAGAVFNASRVVHSIAHTLADHSLRHLVYLDHLTQTVIGPARLGTIFHISLQQVVLCFRGTADLADVLAGS
jgi:hypothetical protein